MFNPISFPLLLLPLLASVSLVSATPHVFDHSKNVSYHGLLTSPHIETFLGIPYGLSTAGSARFTPPRAFVPKRGHVYNATVKGYSCPQDPVAGFLYQDGETYQSEDCLNLLVARPVRKCNETARDLLPVMVYIYGGGLNTGTAYANTAKPDGLILESVANGSPVIYVAMNYRLNIFGFATTEALRGKKSLNLGLRDQRLALEWVQENIQAFGGDPSKVTIFGQSSGGLSVALQILAYGNTRPVPFHSAITESTALEPTMASNISFNATSAIAFAANCVFVSNSTSNPSSSDSLSITPSQIDCLRLLPWEMLLNYTLDFITATSANNDGDVFLPTIDGDFLPQLASELVAEGKFPKIPFMTGWQQQDATLFTDPTITTPAQTRAFFELYYPELNSTILSSLLDLYPVSEFSANETADLSAEFYRSARIFRDILLTCPSIYFATAMAEKYANETTEPPVYLYSGNQTILDNYLDSFGWPGLGVIHTSELAYVYGDLSIYNVTARGLDAELENYYFDPSVSDYKLARQMPRSWSSFASTGNPSVEGRETLQGWSSAFPAGEGDASGSVYVIGGTEPGMSSGNVAQSDERLGERCGFLNSADMIAQLKY